MKSFARAENACSRTYLRGRGGQSWWKKGQAEVPPVRLSRGLQADCGRPSQQPLAWVNVGFQLVHGEFGIRLACEGGRKREVRG
jgi:hypothetical protein